MITLVSECCGKVLQRDDRYCPSCGYECRRQAISVSGNKPLNDEDGFHIKAIVDALKEAKRNGTASTGV